MTQATIRLEADVEYDVEYDVDAERLDRLLALLLAGDTLEQVAG